MKIMKISFAFLLIAALSAIPISGAAKDKSTAPPKNKTWIEPLTGMEFVWVPEGCFSMGQTTYETRLLFKAVGEENYNKYYTDELPLHRVCLDGFWIGTKEVSQAQFQKIMEFNPSHFNSDPDFPVDSVSWDDAVKFAETLTLPLSEEVIRLPTEAEWEYAARGGTDTIFNTGNSLDTDQANYNGSLAFGLNLKGKYRKTSTKVGSFSPNAFGLFDVHGNVWEWCSDWYGLRYYETSPEKNPVGPKDGQMKVLRGGSWFRFGGNVRSATRYKNRQTGQFADTGFRLVKSTVRVLKDPLVFDSDF